MNTGSIADIGISILFTRLIDIHDYSIITWLDPILFQLPLWVSLFDDFQFIEAFWHEDEKWSEA